MARAPGITLTVPLGDRAPAPEDEGRTTARAPTDNLVVVPVFYVVIERLRERFGAEAVAAPAATGPAAPSPGGDGD
jgi:hypothetical protein